MSKLTTESVIVLAEEYISNHQITNDDEKQNIYVLALEYRNKKNAGYRGSFSAYADKQIAKSQADELEDLVGSILDVCDIQYIQRINNEELSNELIYQISRLPKRCQEILYKKYIVEEPISVIAQEYNLTSTRVNQILRKSYRKMRKTTSLKEMYDYHFCSKDFCDMFEDLVNNNIVPERKYRSSDKTPYEKAWESNPEITQLPYIGLKYMGEEEGEKYFSVFYKDNWFIIKSYIDTDTNELVILADQNINDIVPMGVLQPVINYIAKLY